MMRLILFVVGYKPKPWLRKDYNRPCIIQKGQAIFPKFITQTAHTLPVNSNVTRNRILVKFD